MKANLYGSLVWASCGTIQMTDGALTTRAEFDALLAETIEEAIARETAEPGYPVWGALRRHLERMRDISSGGRVPSRKERDRCLPGTIVTRELEPMTDVEVYRFGQRCHELQYYFQVTLRSPWWRLWA